MRIRPLPLTALCCQGNLAIHLTCSRPAGRAAVASPPLRGFGGGGRSVRALSRRQASGFKRSPSLGVRTMPYFTWIVPPCAAATSSAGHDGRQLG